MCIGMESDCQKGKINLTQLRRNVHSRSEKRSGWKCPRPGDCDIIPAPDSEVGTEETQDPHLEPEGETQDLHLEPEGETQEFTWSLRERHKIFTLVLRERHKILTWSLRERHKILTWSLRERHKILTWSLRETQDPHLEPEGGMQDPYLEHERNTSCTWGRDKDTTQQKSRNKKGIQLPHCFMKWSDLFCFFVHISLGRKWQHVHSAAYLRDEKRRRRRRVRQIIIQKSMTSMHTFHYKHNQNLG